MFCFRALFDFSFLCSDIIKRVFHFYAIVMKTIIFKLLRELKIEQD